MLVISRILDPTPPYTPIITVITAVIHILINTTREPLSLEK